jgi:sulfide:quinone oxidoreductase
MPAGVHWLKEQVFGVDPDSSRVVCSSGKVIEYRCLIAAPGIKLDWDGIAGLRETLGSNGVTSNYSIQHAPYTWELVRGLQSGRAVFTQPPMPIKCAGAPQKALYLSCDHWQRQGRLGKIQADFYLAGGVLFGVPDYVPALEGYVRRYNANLHFNRTLKAVDGPARTAVFAPAGETGEEQQVQFDMLHVCPPQQAPDFIRASALSDSAGWIEVDAETLQHARYPNIFGLGDAAGTSNAKTAAAVRKQAPVVAANAIALLRGKELGAAYEGYGSCPLTVERGRVVLAEFNYAGKLAPTLPKWIMDGTKPTRLGWLIKASLLSPMYFHLMLKGREWFAAPRRRARGQSGNPAAAATGPSK